MTLAITLKLFGTHSEYEEVASEAENLIMKTTRLRMVKAPSGAQLKAYHELQR